MYVILWEYQVKPEKRSGFEKAYSPEGAWAELFKKGPGYLGTELIQSAESADIYLTIDRWNSKESYQLFRQQWNAQYEQLDRLCQKLTSHENHIGSFNRVPS